MSYQILSRIIVTSLILWGDGAFASENNHPLDDDSLASCDTVLIPQPTSLNNPEPAWQPSHAVAHTKQAEIKLGYLRFAAVTIPAADALKYSPFSPRAPPLPAT